MLVKVNLLSPAEISVYLVQKSLISQGQGLMADSLELFSSFTICGVELFIVMKMPNILAVFKLL